MAKEEPSNSSSDSQQEQGESSGEEECMDISKQEVPNYEKQRLSRIAENKARMEALGLHKRASSFMPSPLESSSPRVSAHRKGKRKILYEDDDYNPSDNDVAEDDDDEDTEDEEAEDDEEFAGKSASKSRRKQSQKKVAKRKNKLPLEKHSRSKDSINEENDEELMQAIALSLHDTTKKEKASFQDGVGRRKKPQFSSRVQMTDDELILHFFQFDESGKGFLLVRDLQRVSVAHDFIWSDKELADMIHCFDSDGDGKLNLDDFRKIAGRCNMI